MQGEPEQPRVLLWAVPYGLKAADADTVGGKPLSSLVLYEDLSKAIKKQTAPIVLATPSVMPGVGGVRSLALNGGSSTAGKGVRVQATDATIGRVYGNEVGSNTWYGENAGHSITTGGSNSFFGSYAGAHTDTGSWNSFFGDSAGQFNTFGSDNSFFGSLSGMHNTANANSFFGASAGCHNTTGYCNSFFGDVAGAANVTGDLNSFFGCAAGWRNTASDNAFFGAEAGLGNTSGTYNAFFGQRAGYSNTTASSNSFFGYRAGFSNTTASNNSFFGYLAGLANTTGASNSFFGDQAGTANTTASKNSFFGNNAGVSNTTGNQNTFVGYGSGGSNTTESYSTSVGTSSDGAAGISNATAIGYLAKVTQRNSLVLGGVNGVNGAMAETNVSIGTTAPTERLHIVGNLRVQGGGIVYSAPEADVPDYVFEPDYKLMPAEELERFISKEKHLPSIRQASEIKEKGVNLSKFQMKLLEKIEELTLCTLQQAKTINRKDDEIKDLNARLTALEQAMERITKQQAESQEEK